MPLTDLFYMALFGAAVLVLIGLAEIIRRLVHWSAEATRKLVHILVGVLVAATPFVFQSQWPPVVLGGAFAMLNYFAIRYGFFKGMHGGDRRSYGTVFYPLSFVILTLALWHHHKVIFVASMLIMALADAAAAIVGERIQKPRVLHFGPEPKSLQGSAAMFLVSFFIVLICLLVAARFGLYDFSIGRILVMTLIVGVIATVAEVVSFRGSDNLSVPLSVAFVMYYLITGSPQAAFGLLFGMGIAFALAALSYRFRFLSGSGAAALVLLGTLVFGVGGWAFAGPILAFFILSSLLSKTGKKRKQKLLTVFEKSGRRDAGQVLANGGVAGAMLLLWYFSNNDLFYVMYIAALASVTADTWATEIGVLARGNPRSILTLKRVPLGTSGGISILGSFGALLGSFVLVLAGLVFSPHASPRVIGCSEATFILFAGLFASMVDSLLGATVQAQYQCPACSKVTEKLLHCNSENTTFIRGFRWINNDVVNGLCAASGVLFVWLAWLMLG